MLRGCVPVKFERTEDGKIACTYKNPDLGVENTEIYDTVLQASLSSSVSFRYCSCTNSFQCRS